MAFTGNERADRGECTCNLWYFVEFRNDGRVTNPDRREVRREKVRRSRKSYARERRRSAAKAAEVRRRFAKWPRVCVPLPERVLFFRRRQVVVKWRTFRDVRPPHRFAEDWRYGTSGLHRHHPPPPPHEPAPPHPTHSHSHPPTHQPTTIPSSFPRRWSTAWASLIERRRKRVQANLAEILIDSRMQRCVHGGAIRLIPSANCSQHDFYTIQFSDTYYAPFSGNNL